MQLQQKTSKADQLDVLTNRLSNSRGKPKIKHRLGELLKQIKYLEHRILRAICSQQKRNAENKRERIAYD